MSGRVRFIRNHGGVIFLTLSEEGKQVQIIAERSLVSEREFQLLKSAVDTGDILLVTGTAGASRTGTASVIVHGWQMAAKCLHPIPYGALNDPEARIRKRSTDLLVHPQQLENLRMRSSLITAIRRTLDDAGSVSYTHLDVYKRQPPNHEQYPHRTTAGRNAGYLHTDDNHR